MRVKRFILFFICSLYLLSCSCKTIPFELLVKRKNKTFVIDKTIDMGGKKCSIPAGCKLMFRGGVIKNGKLIGNDTMIECDKVAFDGVSISGSWNVPEISSSFFADLSLENALKNLFALASPDVKNVIYIEKGEYKVRADKNGSICLKVCDNTKVVLDGNIRLIPNGFRSCDIIRATGENIKITGKGTIIGDKHTHTGTDGQWGMGIRLHGVKHAEVYGLSIRDCWGDCVYVGGNSKDVTIENCRLDHGRRQGVSVTKADGVVIRNCRITNVGGSNPQYAIDIEPNKGDTVDNVVIDQLIVEECEGGILVTKGKKFLDEKTIGKVEIRNCQISVKSKYPIMMKRCRYGLVEKCIVHSTNERAAISSSDANEIIIRDNLIYIKKVLYSREKVIKKTVGDDSYPPIGILRADKQEDKNNKIVRI